MTFARASTACEATQDTSITLCGLLLCVAGAWSKDKGGAAGGMLLGGAGVHSAARLLASVSSLAAACSDAVAEYAARPAAVPAKGPSAAWDAPSFLAVSSPTTALQASELPLTCHPCLSMYTCTLR